MMRTFGELHLFQWNCRSITNKKNNLLQFLESNSFDVLILQELQTKKEDNFSLRGYYPIQKKGMMVTEV